MASTSPCPAPLGRDLRQLLVGGVESGVATERDLDAIREVLVPGYCGGLADEGVSVDLALGVADRIT